MNEEGTSVPSFKIGINPLSNNLSKSALKSKPFSELNLSLLSDILQGSIWLAINNLVKSIPITTHFPSYFSISDFLKSPLPTLDFTSASFSVFSNALSALIDSTIWISFSSIESIVS